MAENDAGSHRVGSLDIGIVEALHVHRCNGHPEGLAEFFHDTRAEFVGIGMLLLLEGVEMEFPGILRAELKQGHLVALGGNPELDTVDHHVWQEWDDDFL